MIIVEVVVVVEVVVDEVVVKGERMVEVVRADKAVGPCAADHRAAVAVVDDKVKDVDEGGIVAAVVVSPHPRGVDQLQEEEADRWLLLLPVV